MLTLICTAMDAEQVREIAGFNMNLVPAGNAAYNVAGMVGFADQTQKQFQGQASGEFSTSRINLSLGDAGNLDLQATSSDEAGNPVFTGSVLVLGGSDRNNLACRVVAPGENQSN
jgi:hypothetical protein